jgi:A/G-specific adenine glycosylase
MAWRETTNPYHIVVSEVMLQQTQVLRVAQKYPEFLDIFPTFEELAAAEVSDVLKVWSGMGYNRRALYLKKIAEIVVKNYHGELPSSPEILDELPGIGYATACSIVAFAYNIPTIFIETNIRRVFIHFFFGDKEGVDDKEIYPLVEKTIDKKNPREWYYALMDYGTMLAKTISNPNKRSKHYSVQSKFEGSDRQMRGKILKTLVEKGALPSAVFFEWEEDDERVERSLAALKKEGFVMEEKGVYKIK